MHTVRLSPVRAYIVAYATRVQEIADFGQPTQRELPADGGPGYIWRLENIIRAEQRDNGVYLEMQTIALSRGIPAAMRWLVKPLTEHVPRRRILATLDDTRKAVTQLASANAGSEPVALHTAPAQASGAAIGGKQAKR